MAKAFKGRWRISEMDVWDANEFFNRWGDWGLGLKVAAPFGMLERGPC
jgi:hypothetical protein